MSARTPLAAHVYPAGCIGSGGNSGNDKKCPRIDEILRLLTSRAIKELLHHLSVGLEFITSWKIEGLVMDCGNTRRKFLQGSLAAPVVLTVSSASAQTITSFARCLGNLESQQNASFFATAADSWFRAQVNVVQLWSQGQDRGYFFLDQVKNVYVSVVPPYSALTFGQYLAPGWKITGSSTRWALVWFDKVTTTQYSKITVQQPTGYLATTISCYGSFMKAA